MAKRITKTFSRFKSINHFYLNSGKTNNSDGNNNSNEIMIGNPQLEMTHRIK